MGFIAINIAGEKGAYIIHKGFYTPIIIPARPSMFPRPVFIIFRTVYISPFVNGIDGIEPIHYLQIKSRIRIQKCNFQFSVIQSPS